MTALTRGRTGATVTVTLQYIAYLADASQSQQIFGYGLKIDHKCSLKGNSYCCTRNDSATQLSVWRSEKGNRLTKWRTNWTIYLYSFAHELINKLTKDC
jgi:hypothetical protein